MAKILFYHWDWRGQPEMELLQRAVDAVFDGINAPYLTSDVPTANWDQFTVAVCSERIDPREVGEAFNRYMEDDRGYETLFWWELEGPPVPLEIVSRS